MTNEEIVAWQAKERAFLATPIGKAFYKFKSAYFNMASDEYNDCVSYERLKLDAVAAEEAEREFRAELEKLMNETP
jgi:hypothetical protein